MNTKVWFLLLRAHIKTKNEKLGSHRTTCLYAPSIVCQKWSSHGILEESYNYQWQILEESSSFPSPPLFILPDPEVPSESPQGPSNELPPASQTPNEEPGNLIQPPSPSQEPQTPFD